MSWLRHRLRHRPRSGPYAGTSSWRPSLLYRIAGYDANAARCADAIGDLDTPPDTESSVSEWALHTIRDLLSTRSGRDLSSPPPVPGAEATLAHRVRDALWRRLGGAVQRHARWLTHQPRGAPGAIGEVREVINLLRADADEPGHPDIWPRQAAHPDIHHLAILLAEAMGEGEARSLRSVLPPDDDGDGRFTRYVREQAASRPLLWPAARLYAEAVLPGPNAHAVVCVPTGAKQVVCGGTGHRPDLAPGVGAVSGTHERTGRPGGTATSIHLRRASGGDGARLPWWSGVHHLGR